jgi:hypothetical protein
MGRIASIDENRRKQNGGSSSGCMAVWPARGHSDYTSDGSIHIYSSMAHVKFLGCVACRDPIDGTIERCVAETTMVLNNKVRRKQG